ALTPHAAELTDELWRGGRGGNAAARFRGVVALAAVGPGSPRWQKAGAPAVGGMLSANPPPPGQWGAALRLVRRHLLAPLGRVFRGEDKDLAGYRQVAANVLADYASDRPGLLAELLLDADAKQYAVLRPVLEKHREQAVRSLTSALVKQPDWWK